MKKLLILLAFASEVHAVSFNDFYRGNPQRGIVPHKKNIAEQLAKGRLYLVGRHLSDLNGLDVQHLPDFANVRIINLSDNDLTSIPDAFGQLPNLTALYIINNPIPGTTNQLRKTLNLPERVKLFFKSPQQEAIESSLVNAIKLRKLSVLQDDLKKIARNEVSAPFNQPIEIAQIHDEHHNNLMHLLINTAADQIDFFHAQLNALPPISRFPLPGIPETSCPMQETSEESQTYEELLNDSLSTVSQEFIQMFLAINSSCKHCVELMLEDVNDRDELPSDIATERLGPGSALATAISLIRSEYLKEEAETASSSMTDSKGEKEQNDPVIMGNVETHQPRTHSAWLGDGYPHG